MAGAGGPATPAPAAAAFAASVSSLITTSLALSDAAPALFLKSWPPNLTAKKRTLIC